MQIENIKGIGTKSALLLNKLGIVTIDDLANYYPYRYNYFKPSSLLECQIESGMVVGTVISVPIVNYIKRNFNRLSFQMQIDNLIVKVTIFNRAFYKNLITIGKQINVIGKYDQIKNSFMASDIRFETIDGLKIEPVYHLIKGLTNKTINKFINTIDYKYINDAIPDYYSEKYKFIKKYQALQYIHNPNDIEEIKKAKLSLIYEELFSFSFKINYLKNKRLVEDLTYDKNIDDNLIKDFINNLPFKLTIDQDSAIKDILKDLKSNHRMNRLLLGDVGSGKTIVSFIAILANHTAGFQSALMAPTELLAKQHFANMQELFSKLNINVSLILGSTTKKEKDVIKKKLVNKEIDVLIGTHALLTDDVVFNNLGLVVTDEQHRFGVNQRSIIQNKGNKPDILYMSATPIPRTYALTLYKDMDISMIKTKPSNRKDIKTILTSESNIREVLYMMKKELDQKHQIYIVSPLVEENDELDLNDVNLLLNKFTKAFPQEKMAIIHGKLKQKEKDKIMNDFKDGLISILISTTVIEVGIDVKNATMMVIYNAEIFGLATLHQLRGRIGRNELDSTCILISNKEVERLKVLVETNDGFAISEKDFELRGEGDLFGTKQSGDMIFHIANIRRDIKILNQTMIDSNEYLLECNYNDYYQTLINHLNNLN